jgi:transposase InsO family protein
VNCYPFIEAEKAQRRNVKRACELLKVSRAACYAAGAGRPSDRDRADAGLTTRIAAEHKRSKGRYGAPRIHAELRRKGHRHSRKRIARLMRQAGLAAPGAAAVEEDHHRRPGRHRPGGRDPPGLHRRRRQDQHQVVHRHHGTELGGPARPVPAPGGEMSSRADASAASSGRPGSPRLPWRTCISRSRRGIKDAAARL